MGWSGRPAEREQQRSDLRDTRGASRTVEQQRAVTIGGYGCDLGAQGTDARELDPRARRREASAAARPRAISVATAATIATTSRSWAKPPKQVQARAHRSTRQRPRRTDPGRKVSMPRASSTPSSPATRRTASPPTTVHTPLPPHPPLYKGDGLTKGRTCGGTGPDDPRDSCAPAVEVRPLEVRPHMMRGGLGCSAMESHARLVRDYVELTKPRILLLVLSPRSCALDADAKCPPFGLAMAIAGTAIAAAAANTLTAHRA